MVFQDYALYLHKSVLQNILVVEQLGSDALVFFNLREHEMVARLPPERAVREGETLTLHPDLGRMHLFDRETGRAI